MLLIKPSQLQGQDGNQVYNSISKAHDFDHRTNCNLLHVHYAIRDYITIILAYRGMALQSGNNCYNSDCHNKEILCYM